MTTQVKHRINETAVANVTADYVGITQRDCIDPSRNHVVFLTADELRALLAAVEAA